MRSIYSIEGNISSGKSTFLHLLKRTFPQIELIPEPVAQWQRIQNKFNLLDQYYKQPHRWAFTFQINAILSRMIKLNKLMFQIQNTQNTNKVFFSQRSIVADRQIFAQLLHQQNKMNQLQYSLYLNMYNSLNDLFKTPRIHKFIYLHVTPQKCCQRMKKRARHEQSQVQLTYLKKIHHLHEKWLRNQPNTLIIQGEEEFQDNEERAKEMLESSRKFLQL